MIVVMKSICNAQLLLLFILLALSAAGCNQGLYPLDRADIFWRAIQAQDADKLRKSITAESRQQNNLIKNILPVGQVSLGKTVIDGDRAWVDTTVEIKAEKSFSIPLKTILLKENGLWMVDYENTVATLSSASELATVMDSIHELGEQFAKQFNEVLDVLKKNIPQVQHELEKLEEHIKSQIPELKDSLEDLARRLEEALKHPPQDSPAIEI